MRPMEDIAWQRLEELFSRAVELPPERRQSFLTEQCGSDVALRAELESLLEADTSAPGLYAASALDHHRSGEDEADAEALLGSQAGAYRLTETLGHGGMATVFLGERTDGDFAHQVAVKIPNARRGWALSNPEPAARFRAEVATLARLSHPNIVALLDAGTLDDGRPYVLMERVQGERIDRYAERRRLPVGERLRLVEQLCGAVDYAHRHLVVHRDLKAANVLVTEEGVPKLLDFGIATLLTGGPVADAEPAPLTLASASPEQVLGEPVTVASDVYSLGVLLFRLLTGHGPYLLEDPQDRAELHEAVLHQEPEAPSRRRRGDDLEALPADLDAIALTALRKDPAERYPSARELAEELARWRRGEPVAARGRRFGYLFGKLLRRHRWPAAVAAALLVGLLGILIASRVGLERARAGETIAWRAHADAVFVTNYLAGVLEQAGRGELAAAEDVLAVLADAERRMEQDLAEAPEAEARLRYAVARVYAALGRGDDALAHTRRTLELSRDTVGLGWQDEARALDLYADLLARDGDPESVEARRQEGALLHRILGPDHPATLRSEARAARDLALLGRRQEARKRAQELAERLPPADQDDDLTAEARELTAAILADEPL